MELVQYVLLYVGAMHETSFHTFLISVHKSNAFLIRWSRERSHAGEIVSQSRKGGVLVEKADLKWAISALIRSFELTLQK